MTRTPTLERLTRASEEREDGCVVFTGYVDKQGYGRISHGEKREKQLVHRVAYELHIGPIPEGMQIDHLCFTRHCVNPAHLEAVTPMVNNMRSSSPSRFNAEKTHCHNGHAFTAENTYYRQDRRGRLCRACGAARARTYKARRAA